MPPSEPRSPPAGRILLVEDEEDQRLLVETAVAGKDRSVRWAATAEEARAALGEHEFDLVLLDLVLPDGDGRSILAEIRERPRTAALQVMVLSGRVSTESQLEAFRLGADEFFQKPFAPPVLDAAVSRLLERARVQAAETRTDPVTGLANRAALAERFEELRALSERTGAPLGVALVEIDQRTRLREELERDVSDALRRQLAQVVHAALDHSDVVGTWQADELVVLVPGRPLTEARALVDEVLDEVRHHVFEASEAGDDVSLTLSAGLVDGTRFRSLGAALAEGELAVTRARGAGGDRSVVHPADLEPEHGEPEPATIRVLLVEDDADLARLVIHRLERGGMEVHHIDSGSEAARYVEEESARGFGLVLSGVKLPGRDGFELLGLLRERPGWKEVPVIMVTATGRESDVVRAFELGADDYVLKPFSPSELLARIHRLLRRD